MGRPQQYLLAAALAVGVHHPLCQVATRAGDRGGGAALNPHLPLRALVAELRDAAG
jgi:hypothetical protein